MRVRWSHDPAGWCRKAREAGELGLAVTAAAEYLGISLTRFRAWERDHSEFAEATKKVRENSARLLLSRTQKLLGMPEERLLAALAHVRQKKAEERQRIEQAMAQGLIWTPERLAEKVRNLKEIRADVRRDERARQKQRADQLTVKVATY
jgi:hypothetical protein